MDELTGRFRERLRERIETLAADRPALARDAAARSRVREAAHALRGSGGTYGFPEISAEAARVESASDAELAERLDALLVVLRREAAPAAPAPSAEVTRLSAALEAPVAARRASIREQRAPSSDTRTEILIVDDDPDISRLLAHLLAAPDREIRVAGTAAAAEQQVAERSFGLVVLDLVLPDADGRVLLTELRERPATATVPIVVLSALRAGPTRGECFALGADAYIEKPFDVAMLASTVASMLERSARVGRDAGMDPLTSLPNRATFREAFARATAPAAERRPPVAVALVELDQYDAIEAASGWGSADRALAIGAGALARALARAEVVAHWKGAVFAALIVGQPEDVAAAIVADAIAAARTEASTQAAAGMPCTFSAGVAMWGEGRSLEATVVAAERRLLEAKAGAGAAPSAPASGAAREHRILLAEDDDLIASVVIHRLEREGMTVRRFADGLAALEAAPQLEPSLAILDVKMPGMDGFELLARLRELPGFARTPVMMLTSMGSEQDVVRGFELGADEYVVKPFSPVELVARVRRVLAPR